MNRSYQQKESCEENCPEVSQINFHH